MAEIKVLKGERSTVGPVGIVQMGTGGVRAARQMQEAGQRLFETAFTYLASEEKKEGEKAAANASLGARDEDGNWVVPEVPRSLSYVAKQAYEPIAFKRYADSLAIEIDKEANELSKKHKRDPEGFNVEFGSFLDGLQSKLKDTEFAGVAASIGLTNSVQYQKALFNDRAKYEDRMAAGNAQILLNKKSADLEAFAATGALMAPKDLENILEEGAAAYIEHQDYFGLNWYSGFEKQTRLSFLKGNLTYISNKLADSVQPINPDAKQPMLAADLSYMSLALDQRSMEGIPPSARKRLEEAGFTEEYITNPLFNALHDQLSRDIITKKNRVVELHNGQKDIRLVQAATANFGNNGVASQTDADLIIKFSSVNTAEKLIANLNTVMIPPKNEADRKQWDLQFGAVHSLLFENRGPLPTVAKNFFESIDGAMPPEQIPVAVAMYQQATQFNQGTYMETKVDRGLDKKTIVMYETLGAVMDTLGPSRIDEFLQSYRETNAENITPEIRKANLLRATGEKKGTADSVVRKFVIDSIDSDASNDEINFYTQYADELLLTVGEKTTRNILEQASKKIFKESEFLHSTIGRSRFTPERAYPSKMEMDDFKDAVGMKLSLVNSSLKLGETAFLIPDTREGTALPVYNLVDADKRPIIHNGKMLQVGNQLVLSRMAERRNISIAALRQEAQLAEDQYVRLQKEVNNSMVAYP